MWNRHVYMRAGSAAATGRVDCSGDAAVLHDDDEARDGVAAPLSRTLPSPAGSTDLVVMTGDKAFCSRLRTRLRYPGLDVVSTEEIDEGDDPPDRLGRVGDDKGISRDGTSLCLLRLGTGLGCIDGDGRRMSRAQTRQATTGSTRGLRRRTLRHAPPSAGVYLFDSWIASVLSQRSLAPLPEAHHERRSLQADETVEIGMTYRVSEPFTREVSLVRIHVNR